MPAAKRPASASHEEVFDLVKQRKIHVAQDLFRLAEEQSAGGDPSLLFFCTGTRGMRCNLQAELDAMWVPDAGCTSDRAAVVPLTDSRLQQLKHQARGPPLPALVVPLHARTAKTHARYHILEARSALRPSKQGEVTLFDHLRRRAEAVFRPSGGIWRLRDFYEVLATARRDRRLVGVTPSLAAGGGFSIPRSEEGWHSMIRASVASPRVPFCELDSAQRKAVSAEVRFCLSCGAMPWRPPHGIEGDVDDAWIDAMPEDPLFEVDTLRCLPAEERLVRLWAHGHVEDRQWLALIRALEACHHSLQQTVGFKMDNGNLCVTGSKLHSSRHKHGSGSGTFGALCAQACAEEAASKGLRRGPVFAALGDGRVSQQRPHRPPSKAALLALTNGAAVPEEQTRLSGPGGVLDSRG